MASLFQNGQIYLFYELGVKEADEVLKDREKAEERLKSLEGVIANLDLSSTAHYQMIGLYDTLKYMLGNTKKDTNETKK